MSKTVLISKMFHGQCLLCLFPLLVVLRAQRSDNLAPLSDAVPVVLAIDPPTGNDTSAISGEQQDMEAILKNSTISNVAADNSNESVQLDLANENSTAMADAIQENSSPVMAPERGKAGNASLAEAVVAVSDSAESNSTSSSSTTSNSSNSPSTSAASPMVEAVAANVNANANGALPPEKMSLQAIPSSNGQAQQPSTDQSTLPTTSLPPNVNFAQLSAGQGQQQQTPLLFEEAQQVCTSAGDCNGRGTCFGIRGMPLCLCQAGYTGSRCQLQACNSTQNCNGRGWCVGTLSQFTCFCNFGYSGAQCENQQSGRR